MQLLLSLCHHLRPGAYLRPFFATMLGVLAGISSLNASLGTHSPLLPHVPHRVLVRPLPDVSDVEIMAIRERFDAVVEADFPQLNDLELWKLGDEFSVATTLGPLLETGKFDLVEPDYLVYSTALPNDPQFQDSSLWHYANTGQRGGSTGADIGASKGWDIRHLAESVIVAIIDTGARQTHEDLIVNLWRNSGEIPGNRIDDDQNGYVDDIHGINSILNNGDPEDDAGHGTHVAGLIGATGNNGIGTTGVAWDVQLMPLRMLNRFGEGATSDAIECISYAVENGAHVINMSWGSNAFSGALNGAISLAQQANIVVVAAAGNERRNNDVTPLYPASYTQNNVLSIAATTNRDTLSSYSNYGARSVDLAAPGDAILSTWASSDRAYQVASGTSMSCPMVAGAAALLRAQFPNTNAPEIVARLIATADPLPGLRGRSVSGGRLNLGLALGPDLIAGFDMTPPGGAPPLQVTFSDRSLGEVNHWIWDFGDGQTASGSPTISHTYNRAGNFPVTLTIESPDGFSVQRTQRVPIVANYRVELDFFNWLTPSDRTTLSLDKNDISAPIELPFLFPFYARAHDQIFIGSNGILGFVPDELSTPENQAIPNGALPNALIAAYWDNLDPERGGSISYGTIGSAPERRFVVTWDRVPLADTGSALPLTFQAILEEGTQRVVVQFQEVQPHTSIAGGASATIGLENHGGFLSARHLVNGSRILRNEQTIAFTPLASNGMIVGPERDIRIVREVNSATALDSREFQLLNTGSELIGWQATTDEDWLKLTKFQGVLGAGQAEAVGIWIDPAASPQFPGSYFASVSFRNLTSGTGSVEKKVQLLVNGEHASWMLSPSDTLAASGPTGGPFSPVSRIYTLVNDGDRLLDWRAQNSEPWIEIQPDKNLLGSGDSESISVRFKPTVSAFAPGVYESTIEFSDQQGATSPLRIVARLVIQGNSSALVTLPDEEAVVRGNLPWEEGTTIPTYEIHNQGTQAGTWQANTDVTWLKLSPSGSRLEPGARASLDVLTTPEINVLPPGPHEAQITIIDQSNSNSTPVRRWIRLQIVENPEFQVTSEITQSEFIARLRGAAHSRFVVEQSNDLTTWQPLSVLETSNQGAAVFRAPLNANASTQFFRFRATENN